ncbi:MAG: hypothetical protein H6942_15005 [Candidatus Accumulibacter sp.]|uniref:hypothetical protein n=1 Tax=Accumulibacter sp. TaxID=2053492 RepID=UPI0019E6FE94|nr:hypothetical protein [Accumulibacter sp.]MBE2259227.1 hypothetical protein [Paracoccaceae bacterium]MCB1943188.1 hypothetical protein [Accumulibacter sp.]MCP5249820.1 hypothetical protein [Accumulibacter sp.]
MGILDWFRNRPAQFDTDRLSSELIRSATEKAITLTNPRLNVLPACHARLAPAVATAIGFVQAMVEALPSARPVSSALWSSDRVLRAFFAAPGDIPAALGRSGNLKTLFDKFPELDEACVTLGMAIREQQILGTVLHGAIVRRDVVQTSVSFSDHRTHACGRDESELRRLVGVQAFEYLLAQALSEIGEDRVERQELEGNRALIRARLRLLRDQGPGLGSMFAAAREAASEQGELEAKLLDNERQLEAIGDSGSALEMELACLIEVLENPGRYLRVAQKRLRLNTMNVLIDETSSELAVDVDFSIADLGGTRPLQRAFVLARCARGDVPAQAISFDDAARYLL